MIDFVITFGHDHPHAGKYYIITASDDDDACAKAYEKFGNPVVIHTSKRSAGVDEMGLHELKWDE